MKNTLASQESNLDVSVLFYAIYHEPATSLIRSQVHTEPDSFILILPGTTQTSVIGVFAVGGLQDTRCGQVTTGTGSGTWPRLLFVICCSVIGRHRSSMCFPIYTRSRISQSPVPYNVVSPLHLLPTSRSLYRRQPHSIHRPPLVRRQSLYRPRALPDDLEYCVELSCYHLLVHMGRHSS